MLRLPMTLVSSVAPAGSTDLIVAGPKEASDATEWQFRRGTCEEVYPQSARRTSRRPMRGRAFCPGMAPRSPRSIRAETSDFGISRQVRLRKPSSFRKQNAAVL